MTLLKIISWILLLYGILGFVIVMLPSRRRDGEINDSPKSQIFLTAAYKLVFLVGTCRCVYHECDYQYRSAGYRCGGDSCRCGG
jgi:hypothetical protein